MELIWIVGGSISVLGIIAPSWQILSPNIAASYVKDASEVFDNAQSSAQRSIDILCGEEFST